MHIRLKLNLQNRIIDADYTFPRHCNGMYDGAVEPVMPVQHSPMTAWPISIMSVNTVAQGSLCTVTSPPAALVNDPCACEVDKHSNNQMSNNCQLCTCITCLTVSWQHQHQLDLASL